MRLLLLPHQPSAYPSRLARRSLADRLASLVCCGLLVLCPACAGAGTEEAGDSGRAPTADPAPAADRPPAALPPTGGPPSSGPALPAPTPAGDSRAAVVAAYARFWMVAGAVDSRPVSEWYPALAGVAAEPLLGRVYDGLRALRAAGRRQYGTVVVHVRVVEVRSGRASVVDCQDASGSGELDAGTGLPRTAGLARTLVAASLVRCRDGRWRVAEARYLDGGC